MSGSARRASVSRLRPDVLVGVLVAAGIVLRVAQLVGGASLSSDEAMLGLNIVGRSFGGLADRLDFNQAAPVGLLVLEKAATRLGGAWDLELRAVPFVAGVAGLVAFPALARRVVETEWAVVVATLLFAISDPLVYWSATDKQYAVDACAAVVIPLLALRALERRSRAAWAAFAAAAVGGQFLSHPSAFAVAATIVGLACRERARAALAGLAAVAGAAAVAFAVAYHFERTGVRGVATSLKGTPGAFASGSSGTVVQSVLGAFRYVVGIPTFLPHGSHDLGEPVEVLAILLVVLGLAAIASRSPALGILVGGPFVLVGIASAAHLYPLLPRTLVFLFPSLALALVSGLERVARLPLARARELAVLATAVVVAVSGADAVKHLASPRTRQQIEPVLSYLARVQRPDDAVYVFYKAQYGLAFYLRCPCAPARVRRAEDRGFWPVRRAAGGPAQWAPALASLAPQRVVVGSDVGDDPAAFARELARLRDRGRVWVLVSDVDAALRRRLLGAAAEAHATLVQSYVGGPDASAAGAYLFRFRR